MSRFAAGAPPPAPIRLRAACGASSMPAGCPLGSKKLRVRVRDSSRSTASGAELDWSDAAVRGDVQHDRKRGHAERDGRDRQKYLDGRIRAFDTILPRIELALPPFAERRRTRIGAVILPPDAPQHVGNEDRSHEESAYHREQKVGVALAGKTPDADDEHEGKTE